MVQRNVVGSRHGIGDTRVLASSKASLSVTLLSVVGLLDSSMELGAGLRMTGAVEPGEEDLQVDLERRGMFQFGNQE